MSPLDLVVFALDPIVPVVIAALIVLALICLAAAIHEGHRP